MKQTEKFPEKFSSNFFLPLCVQICLGPGPMNKG
jgi:hypothetical protein